MRLSVRPKEKNFITDPQFFKPLSVYLDDMLADRLMEKHPYMFGELPKRFKTPERLVIAIDNSKRETNCYIRRGKLNKSLLTYGSMQGVSSEETANCPEFPENVWTREFVDYCMEHGTCFRWFRQMPKKFQTSANTQAAYDYGHYHICDFAKRFITRKWRRSATGSTVMHMPSRTFPHGVLPTDRTAREVLRRGNHDAVAEKQP